jgi:type II secretory pathway component GspD/PulD (secretin)
VKIVGNTKIIADTRANSIVVLGNESVKEKVFRTLDLLDRRQHR